MNSGLKETDGGTIRQYCHVNSNEDGDRFVGVKADSDKVEVCFPIGYQLPETDWEMRADIRNLIRILSDFHLKEERFAAQNSFAGTQATAFPIDAYCTVIEYYFSLGGKYYVETDPSFRTRESGKQDWPKTFRNQTPFVQKSSGGCSSFIYPKFTVRSSVTNGNKAITQINKYCVYEAFSKIGWLYVSFMPEKPDRCPEIKSALQIVRDKLKNTNDDRKKKLFRSMLEMLEYKGKRTCEHTFYFGTDHFDYVWEKMIDRTFGERHKDGYFPRTRWFLDYGRHKENRPLMPDSIMIHNGTYYVLDAKYYRYGCTGNPLHLPNASSISKQVIYGEYLEKTYGLGNDRLFNAFIMPYNKKENVFGLTEPIGVIGEAVSDWKNNKRNYERVQGIVIDTRYLMRHYAGNSVKIKDLLANCIEAGLNREEIPDR